MIRVALGAALVMAWGSALAATGAPPPCGTEDLLAGRSPSQTFDVRGNSGLVTDGQRIADGSVWNAPAAVLLEDGASFLTWDLGAPTPVSALYAQADANDRYEVSGSLDGTSFTPLGAFPIVPGDGLRGRVITREPVTLRWLRIGAPSGDRRYSLSELAAYCRAPTPFPPSLKMLPMLAPPQRAAWWNDVASARVELVLALAGLVVLAYGLRRPGRRFDAALLALGGLSFAAYFNFGTFHFGGYVHQWDTFHYYVGSKYFAELSYDRLYDCTAIADSEEPGWRPRVAARTLRDLRTNEVTSTAGALADPQGCKQHFSPDRWLAFRHDVGWFRSHFGPSEWERVQIDHGYNATPVWTLLGSMLANLSPASGTQIWWLTRIDPLLFVAMLALIGWSFGWRTLCVAMLVLATNFPSRFYWTGGSFLRWDWLFYLTASVCLLRRQLPLAAGVCLGYAALLRIFPGLAIVGPLMLLGHARLTGAAVDRRLVRFVAGAALCVGVLLPLSLARVGGVATARAFVQNTVKHASTPLTNYMGWRTVVAWNPHQVGRLLRAPQDRDPWHTWKQARRDTFAARRWLYALGVLGALILLWRAVRRSEPWVAAAASLSLIAVVPELTCYYYAFLLVVALLWQRHPLAGVVLMAMTAAGGVVVWSPLHLISTWDDERYVLLSALTLAALAAVLALCASPKADRTGDPAPG